MAAGQIPSMERRLPMETKKAVLVTSFGTSHLDTLEKTIAATEQAIAQALPDCTLRRAFTSTIIMKKLRSRDGMEIDSVPQALDRLLSEGYTQAVIQPTHVLCGEEYDKLCALAAPYAEKLQLSLGQPLLRTIDDYWEVARAIEDLLPKPAQDEAILFMGHGSPHFANASYALLQYLLEDLGAQRTYIGTVEGLPTLDQVIRRMEQHPEIKKVRVMPLMMVAGDHANNDMAGPEEDSWKSILTARGYQVDCILQGLGEFPAFRQLFVRRALTAAEKFC